MTTSLTPAELASLADAIAERVTARLKSLPDYLGREEMARYLGVSVPTIDRWCKHGVIPVIKIGGRVKFDPVQVREALRRRGELSVEMA